MKKSISIILAISIVFGFAVPVSAMTGAETELNPYMISTPADLMAISDDLSAHYKLANDIDMSGVYDYKPIGNAADGAFTGSLDGNGFAIKNLTIDLPGEKYTGLFGYSEGDIRNLTLLNVCIVGGRYVGGIAGYSGLNGSINNCSVEGYITSQNALIDITIGGIAGAYCGTMSGCETSGSITITNTQNNFYEFAGGLIGASVGNILLTECENRINLDGSNSSLAIMGGLIGKSQHKLEIETSINYGYINNNYISGGIIGNYSNNLLIINTVINYGEITTGDGGKSGGIVGSGSNYSTISLSRSSNYGTVTSGGYSGGLLGNTYNCDSTIKYCNNYGLISAEISGGIIGHFTDSYTSRVTTICYCINNGQIISYDTKYPTAGGIVGKTETNFEMLNCQNNGTISANATEHDYIYAGGLVGETEYGNGTISQSCNTGNVYASPYGYTWIAAGGIVGYIDSETDLINCYNIGNIFSKARYSGGSGGIVGGTYNTKHNISKCYSIGKLQENYDDTSCIDPLVADGKNHATVSDFYYDEKSFAGGLTSKEMKDKISYKNWDFDSVWYIEPSMNNGYPMLRCFKDEQYAMNISSSTLQSGDTISLKPYLNSESIEDVNWTSSDSNVAVVSSNGTVTANNAGVATITATTSDGHKINSSVSVIKPCGGITITDKKVNKNSYINVTAALKDSSSNEIISSWQSSDTSIATVSANGTFSANITGVNIGTCEITATSTLGETATFTVTVTSNATSISLSPTSTTVNRGKTKTLTATVTPSPTQSALTWSSSDESVATVNQNGVITGVSCGQAIITAKTNNGYSATCTVTVKAPVETLTMDKSAVTVTKGYTDKVVAAPYPLDTTDTITYSTSSSSIVSVNSSTGVITGYKAGTATITATASSGAKAYCTVTVVNPTTPVTGITLDREEINIHAGELVTLSPQVVPSGATNQQLIWSVADESVATVNQTGVVKGIAEGSTVVTATTVDGGYSVSCTVNVIIDVVAIKLNKDHLDMNSNEKASLIATVMPDNASNKNVIWSSSEESIAKVDQNGVVTAVSQGVAVITAKTQDWNKIATCFITVTEPVDTVRISSTSASVVLDKSITLTASVLPENATYPEISWSSSDNSVASVDEKGVVTAHKLGIATITATAHNGKYTKCEIYVVSFEGAEYTDFVCEKTADGTGVIIKEYCGTSSDVIIPRAIGNLPVTTLGNALFVNCEQTIETLTIPETVTTIDVNSFGSSVGLVRCYEYSAAHEYAAANNLNYELIYEMTLSAQSATLYRGDEKQLSVAITPSAMANSAISWSSSNNSVATVSDNGLIVANMQGTAIITATDEFGNDVTCRVRVIPRTPTIYIYNFDRSYEWKLDWWKPYSSAKMKLTYYSYNCEDAVRFEWSSSNKRVKIDSAGNITNTGFFGRSSIITIKAYDAQGNVIASSDVKVMFYKFKWQKDRLQTQAIVSDNYLDRDVPEQTLDKTVENETVAVFSYFIEYMERIFKFLIF